ncbi:uncharacterized protein LOC143861359 [Tasmannia lanceolata]|uniref:uncharacterized protein LOC143861359 n=1 Tax=Tasmannia lanceolata TaxID=3420 RepID=UPI004064A1F0
MELTAPKTIREVQRLTGMIAALGRFISKSAERCLPFFSVVKGLKTAPWTEECQTAFEELKQYLSSPPLLTKPEPGEELFLYLSISSTALAAVLVREEHRQQKPIYYVSKFLHDAEIKYLGATRWAVELSEFDIKYAPRPAIKAQVLADFVAECTIPQQIADPEAVQPPVVEKAATNECIADGTETEIIQSPAKQGSTTAALIWEVHVDGSSNKSGCGAGLILTGPDDFTADYALRIPRTENAKADLLSKLAASGCTTLGSICMEFLRRSSIEGEAAEIMQRFTSVAHPQTNGQTEVTNRILLQGIKKRLDEKGGRWADELYHVLWAYRTTPRTPTGESPFNLSFGTEAVIPVDIGAPSPRITSFNEQLNSDELRANLDLLEEIREESRIRVAAYKQRVSNYHDSKDTSQRIPDRRFSPEEGSRLPTIESRETLADLGGTIQISSYIWKPSS